VELRRSIHDLAFQEAHRCMPRNPSRASDEKFSISLFRVDRKVKLNALDLRDVGVGKDFLFEIPSQHIVNVRRWVSSSSM